MNYMLQIYSARLRCPSWESLSESEQGAVIGGVLRDQPDARRDRRRAAPAARAPRRRCASQDGRTLTTDGPFPETKEALGGYYLLEADDLDAAIELAARIPAARTGWRGRGATAGGALIEQVFREQWGRVLAALVGFLGDFDLAEEAAQEAFAIAAERWPREGQPAEPARVARGDRAQPRDRPHPPRAHARRPSRSCWRCPRPWRTRSKQSAFRDERLELIFTCCHPALALDAQVALTLRTLGGLTHRGDRARLPRARGDDGAAPRARQAQDPRCGDPLSDPARAPAARSSHRGARGRLPDLQRGLRRARRALRRRRFASAPRSRS